MWKMWATQARMKPCSASHTLSPLMDSRGHAVHLRIIAGQGGGHAADGHGPAPQADRDQAPEDVGEERRGLDVHAEAVGPDRLGVGHDELEDARLQVPAGGVQARGIGAERVEHLVHLPDRGQRLDEGDAADHRVLQEGQALAARVEEVPVPHALGRALELGQVEVDALAAVGLGAPRVVERERGAEDGGGDRRAVHRHLGLVEGAVRARGA